MVLNPQSSILVRGREETWKRAESHVVMEVEMRVCSCRPKECLEPLEAARGKRFLLEVSEEAWPCHHLDFRLLAFRTGREWIFDIKLPSL